MEGNILLRQLVGLLPFHVTGFLDRRPCKLRVRAIHIGLPTGVEPLHINKR